MLRVTIRSQPHRRLPVRASLPLARGNDLWPVQLRAILRAGPWSSTSDILQAALNTLLVTRPELRLAVASELYGNDQVSLSRAAEIADTDLWSFKDYLYEHGIEIVMPEHSAAEMDARIAAFEQAATDDPLR